MDRSIEVHRFAAPSGQLVRFQARRRTPRDAPLAIFLHGRNGTVDDRADTAWLTELNEDGWVVAGGQLYGNHWGGPRSAAGLSELLATAGRFTTAPVVLLIGGSMGALAALNWIRFGDRPVTGAYLVQPCCSLSDRWDNDSDHRAEIDIAYAGDDPRPWDPMHADAGEFSAAVRYRFVSSPGDSLIRPEAHAAPMADRLASITPREISTLHVSGGHGDPSHFDAADLAAFAGRCLVGVGARPR
ncbi:hypothetical protein DY240_00275 [Jiangella rhizosphaerae]|uniref:Alpha/beta hydrolase n=2 Tax=Jiangella rhizosphaerae TaxID=2293569 RepID=A0A418KXF8_9ACTN|nr:hypothetical protein DY240_00275 [Jiangella rhizosphaerae]